VAAAGLALGNIADPREVTFIGCPFLRRGRSLAVGQRPPRFLAHLLFVSAAVRSGPFSEI
jgi:hypothetical protein